MRLAIHNGAREWRGNEKMTLVLADALRRRGHHVVISCHPRGALRDRLEESGVPHVFQRPGGDLDPWSAWRFSAWLRRERIDTLLLTTWKRVPWASWAGRRAGVARIVMRLGLVRPLPDRWHYRLAFRRWIDALVVNSPDIRDVWIDSAPGIPADGVHLVPNGIRIPEPAEPGRLRGELRIERDVPLLLGVGGLEPRKGFDLAVEALARVPAPAHLAIAGTGAAADALRDLAARLGIADRVHLLGQRSDIASLLADADLFLLCSRNEGMAVAMLEAMAAGVPVVATDVSGVDAALGEAPGRGPAGWIVPAGDAAAVADGIDRALEAIREGAEAEKRSREALCRVREWFSEERMVDRMERALEPDPAAVRASGRKP